MCRTVRLLYLWRTIRPTKSLSTPKSRRVGVDQSVCRWYARYDTCSPYTTSKTKSLGRMRIAQWFHVPESTGASSYRVILGSKARTRTNPNFSVDADSIAASIQTVLLMWMAILCCGYTECTVGDICDDVNLSRPA